ncbi:MAG: alpha/beta fold hydrolase [Solirubrobacteraceae bacterium]|nr:alpha/beta fold hydrolase [Solirubrobacteraceae bacterium]
MPAPLVLLHGFTQTGASWDLVQGALDLGDRRVLTPDQRGHGTQSATRPTVLPAMAADVMRQVEGSAELALAGYSMGGRAALLAALASPGRVTHLALISTTAGIQDEAERAARVAADDTLATRIEGEGIEAFAAEWGSGPLFAGQSPDVASAAREDRLRNDAAGLAASLRGAGTGKMGSLWGGLGALTMPVLVLTGERDDKFTAIGERLADEIPGAEHVVVPGAGHQLPLEAPEAVAAELKRLLAR